MYEIVVAWYVIVALQHSPVTIGPFSHETQCEKLRQWLHRSAQYASVSECYYGPAISIAKPSK